MSATKVTAALTRKGIRLDFIAYERRHLRGRGWLISLDERDRAKLVQCGFGPRGTKKWAHFDTLPEVFEWVDTLPTLKTRSPHVITYHREPCGIAWLNIEDPT